MITARTRTGRRSIATVVLGAMVATGAFFVSAAPATAAEGDVTNATLDWGVKDSWRSYIGGMVAGPNIGGGTTFVAPASATPAPYRWDTTGTGSYDETTGQSVVDYAGGVRWTFPSHGIDVNLSNLTVTINADGTGTIVGDYSDPVRSVGPGRGEIATLATGGATINVSDGLVSYSNVTAVVGTAGQTLFGSYPVGTAMDPVSFTFSYEGAPVAVPTATTLTSVTPADTVVAGTTVTLNASVTPADAIGAVQFYSNTGAALGAPVPLEAGTASLPTSDLAAGSYALSAAFVPTDAAAFEPSASGVTPYTVTPAPADPYATTTTLSVAPSAPAVLGEPVTLTATVAVTPAEPGVLPSGTVEFFDTPAGATTPVSIGSAALSDGVAPLTPALVAGGHSFSAVYTPSSTTFVGSSTAAATPNYGVVDTSVPATCAIDAYNTTSTGATASWDFSDYSISTPPAAWARSATGDVSVDGMTFEFSGGEVLADADCAQVSFDGSFTVAPHGMAITFADPMLTISQDGSGTWTADVTMPGAAGSQRLAFATFSGATGVPADGESATVDIAFDYAGSTALGTWSAAYDSAWPNEFVLAVPSDMRAYFYQSSTSTPNLRKPPSPATFTFEWPEQPTATSVSVAASPAAPVAEGELVTLTATVTPAAAGTIEFVDNAIAGESTVLGSADVDPVTGRAELGARLSAGGHQFDVEFTPADPSSFYGSAGVSVGNYGVVDLAAPAACTVGPDAAVRAGVSAAWDYSAYSNSGSGMGSPAWTKTATGDITVSESGSTFVLEDGIARIDGECMVVSFSGTMSVVAHGIAVELTDPVLAIDGDGGVWTADVTTSENDTAQRLVVATIASADVTEGAAIVDFAYEGTSAAGSWGSSLNEWTGAWSNQFVWALPTSIRAFYYQSGAMTPGTPQANKPPAPLTLTALRATVTPSSQQVVQGGTITFTGANFGEEDVTATVYSDPVVLGTQAASADGSVSFTWTVPTDFAPGVHTIELVGEFSSPVSATFAVTALPVVPVNPDQPACVARVVSGGTLSWGVKESFRNYINGPIANGSVSLNGVGQSGGAYVWSGGSGSYNTNQSLGLVRYGGGVTFTGHGGDLNLQISNPRVQITGPNSGLLIADVYSAALSGPDYNASGVAIATLGLPAATTSGSSVSWYGASATLTTAGAQAFGGFYEAGIALDPVSVTFPLGAETPCNVYTDGELSRGGSADLLWIALLLLIAGAGVFVVTRRVRARA